MPWQLSSIEEVQGCGRVELWFRFLFQWLQSVLECISEGSYQTAPACTDNVIPVQSKATWCSLGWRTDLKQVSCTSQWRGEWDRRTLLEVMDRVVSPPLLFSHHRPPHYLSCPVCLFLRQLSPACPFSSHLLLSFVPSPVLCCLQLAWLSHILSRVSISLLAIYHCAPFTVTDTRGFKWFSGQLRLVQVHVDLLRS